MNDLTTASHETFMLYADDAANWSGNPWVSEGNIEPTKAQRGNLSDLVKKGLIEIVDFEPGTYIKFTPDGIAYATANGIDLSWIGA